jgi:hypothetical protein
MSAVHVSSSALDYFSFEATDENGHPQCSRPSSCRVDHAWRLKTRPGGFQVADMTWTGSAPAIVSANCQRQQPLSAPTRLQQGSCLCRAASRSRISIGRLSPAEVLCTTSVLRAGCLLVRPGQEAHAWWVCREQHQHMPVMLPCTSVASLVSKVAPSERSALSVVACTATRPSPPLPCS